MISVDLNKKLKVNPEANGNLSLAIVDKSINKIIYVEEDFNKPVELNQSYYLDLMFLVADKDKKEHYSFNMPVLNTIVVEIHSRALGDQIAWLPIVDEFQKNMNCKVVLRCYFDKLFRRFYPNLDIRHQYFKGDKNVKKEYIEAEAVYILGYAVNGLTNDDGLKVSPIDCRTISLQEVACHQLGLEPKEIRPSFKSNIKKRLIKKKYIAITTCGAGDFKFWHYPNGWGKLVKYYKSKGYEIVHLGDTPFKIDGTINKTGKLDWEVLINILNNAELFIGLPSGLSWLAWASEQKVVTIDGITEDFAYFSCVKVQNKDVCHGCWNSTEFIYDAQGLYCPRNKDFECTKSITPQMVINEIDKIL